MDSRQSMSMMGPPGYPHMPQMSSTGPTMTGDTKPQRKTRLKLLLTATMKPYIKLFSILSSGHHAQMNQQHMIPTRNFQMHRMPADDIQDDFDWDSIV